MLQTDMLVESYVRTRQSLVEKQTVKNNHVEPVRGRRSALEHEIVQRLQFPIVEDITRGIGKSIDAFPTC